MSNDATVSPERIIVRNEDYPNGWVVVTLAVAPDGKAMYAIGGDREPGEGDTRYIGFELIRRKMEPDLRRISDKFTEVIAKQLHHMEQLNMHTIRAEDITNLAGGYVERYQNDYIFHAKVQSVVANLMNAMDDI